MPLFTSGRLRRQLSYFRRVAQEILDDAEAAEVIEASAEIAVRLPGRITCDLLGVPRDQHTRFKELTEERLELLHINNDRRYPVPGTRTIDDVRADLWKIVGPVVQERRADPQDDAISLLVAAQEQGNDEITETMTVNMLLHLLTGGFETTQHLVEMLIDLFADRPDLWTRLRDNRALIDPAIEEMLRWEAPVQAQRRRAVQDIVIHDVKVPKDAPVIAVLGAGNRDERAFPRPDEYDLDGQPGRHLAFSLGVHYCPGAPVTRFEVHALLDEMLDRYVGIERAGPSVRLPHPDRMPTLEVMRGLSKVPVRLRRR
jgi:cytochrome P450